MRKHTQTALAFIGIVLFGYLFIFNLNIQFSIQVTDKPKKKTDLDFIKTDGCIAQELLLEGATLVFTNQDSLKIKYKPENFLHINCLEVWQVNNNNCSVIFLGSLKTVYYGNEMFREESEQVKNCVVTIQKE